MFMNLYFGIPQIIVTVALLCHTVTVWYRHIGEEDNALTSIIACAIQFGLLYWGGLYTK